MSKFTLEKLPLAARQTILRLLVPDWKKGLFVRQPWAPGPGEWPTDPFFLLQEVLPRLFKSSTKEVLGRTSLDICLPDNLNAPSSGLATFCDLLDTMDTGFTTAIAHVRIGVTLQDFIRFDQMIEPLLRKIAAGSPVRRLEDLDMRIQREGVFRMADYTYRPIITITGFKGLELRLVVTWKDFRYRPKTWAVYVEMISKVLAAVNARWRKQHNSLPRVDFTERLPTELRCIILDHLRPKIMNFTVPGIAEEACLMRSSIVLANINRRLAADFAGQLANTEYRVGEDLDAPHPYWPRSISEIGTLLMRQLAVVRLANPQNITFAAHFKPDFCRCGAAYEAFVDLFLTVLVDKLDLSNHVLVHEMKARFIKVYTSASFYPGDWSEGETRILSISGFDRNIALRCLVLYGAPTRAGSSMCRAPRELTTQQRRIEMTTTAVRNGLNSFKDVLYKKQTLGGPMVLHI